MLCRPLPKEKLATLVAVSSALVEQEPALVFRALDLLASRVEDSGTQQVSAIISLVFLKLYLL